jgi:RNA 3'-terminal phosphate cyclase (ATP)
VGSKSFEFKAKLSPSSLENRTIRIKADSAASILLVFQAILPFLIFAGDEKDTPITVTIEGGTNVSFSLSFEYLDQVLLPALERFGVKVERNLEMRGWSHGTRQLGSAKFKLFPLPIGDTLKAPLWPAEQGTITQFDISIAVPKYLRETLMNDLVSQLEEVFGNVETSFKVVDDSRHPARIYTLLVAHTSTGLRFGRDWLYDGKTRDKAGEQLSREVSRRVVKELNAEIQKGGVVDEYLQDQLVVFQALADGKSSIPSTFEALTSERERVDRTDEPFGGGSTHTTTARWVTSKLLPHVKWIDRGRVCEGAGWKVTKDGTDSIAPPMAPLSAA